MQDVAADPQGEVRRDSAGSEHVRETASVAEAFVDGALMSRYDRLIGSLGYNGVAL